MMHAVYKDTREAVAFVDIVLGLDKYRHVLPEKVKETKGQEGLFLGSAVIIISFLPPIKTHEVNFRIRRRSVVGEL